MPGFLHDGVVTLLEQHPTLLLDAWSRAGELVPTDGELVVLPNELRLTFAAPGVRHLQPDLVVRLDRAGARPRFGTAEVLATRAPRRAATWQSHAFLLEQLYGETDPMQLLIPLGSSIQRWVTRQIADRIGISRARVFGPSLQPSIETLAEARANPWRAALAAAILRERVTPAACEAAVEALLERDDPLSGDYIRMILTAVPNPELKKELMMLLRKRVIEVDEADKQGWLYRVAYEDGERAGREEGCEAGRVEMLLRVMAARGLAADGSLPERLRECTPVELERAAWLAVTVSSLREFETLLFGRASGLDG